MRYAIVHIADIHYKKEEPEGCSSIIANFSDDLQRQVAALDGFIIYVATTGDIVQAGNDNDSYAKQGYQKPIVSWCQGITISIGTQ